MLDDANQFHPNIKLVRQIGKRTAFLDLFVENNNGVLVTSVYHKEMSEPYILPFNSDHPRHIFKSIINAALIRAIRYSSTLSTFNTERRTIKLTLLYNGYHFPSYSKSCTFTFFHFSYPPKYITSKFYKFFSSYCSISNVLPIIDNDNDFAFLRQTLLTQPTVAENQIASRTAQSIKFEPGPTVDDPLTPPPPP